MPVSRITGNILTATADLVVIPVNTVGVMGKGLARDAAKRWPDMAEDYRQWCRESKPTGGAVAVWCYGERVCWFATKESWRHPSRMEWVADGLGRLRDLVIARNLTCALPLLGAGLGGLDPIEVERRIEAAFADVLGVELWTL